MTPNNFRVKSGLIVGTTISGGNTTISGFANVIGGVSLSNGTSNFINWSTAGVQGPSINTRSPGTKLLLYPALSASQTDYAIGISPATIWSTVPSADDSFKFKWYGADIEVASLSGAGNMVVSGSINAASHTVGTSFVANTSRVVIGTAVGLQANGGIGSAGQVLHSNGTTVYWAADDGITSLVAANGLSGGTITSTGQLDVVGGAGLISNSTGVHVGSANGISVAADAVGVTTGSTLTVNATGIHVNTSNLSIATSQLTGDVALGANTSGNYVATITNANGISGSSSAEGGTPTIGVVTGSTLTVNTTGIHVNSALSIASLALSGDITVSGNLTVSGTRTYVNTTTLDVGDNIITLNADLGAAAPSQNAGIEIMRGTSANVQFLWDETNDRWSTNGQPLAVSSFIAAGAASGITTLAAGNTTITGFVNATSSINAASLTVGTNFVANSTQTTFGTPVLFNNQQQLRFQTVNTSAYAYFTQQNDDNFVFYTSNTTYGARAVFSVFANSINSNLSIAIPLQPTAGIVANASFGSSGQVLKTNGSTIYWDTAGGTGTVTSVATANGLSGGPITATGTIGVVTGSTLTVNSTGIHVNSALSIDQIITNNNGNGTNVKIGDDAWFGDVNQADTVRVVGQQSANNGYIVFGNANNDIKLGRAGLGPLTYNGAFAAGNTTITGFANVTSTLQVGGVSTFSGNVVLGSVGVSANGGFGTAGQVLHSNGTATYWAADDNAGGTVTSIATANGLTGGTITTTGTLGVATGSTLTVNTTGIHVNSTLSITSLTLAGALSGVTTAAMGNTTITGFANVSSTITSVSGLMYANNLLLQGDGTNAYIRPVNAGSTLHLGANNQNLVYVVANGNFGVGNSAPASKMVVGGTSGPVTTPTALELDNSYSSTAGFDKLKLYLLKTGSETYGFGLGANADVQYWAGSSSTGIHRFYTSQTERAQIAANGNFGIGTTTPGYKLEVNGSFAATTKSFVIPHPTKPGMNLRYGSLEGPENGVYVRGRLRAGEKIIQLPDYWEGLVDQDTYTVNLTPVGKHQELYVEYIASDYIIVGGENIDCFYTVFAERNDVEKLEVEF